LQKWVKELKKTNLDIYNKINELAPYCTALSYDNSGFNIGDKYAEPERVLLALDITNAVIDEAVRLDAKLIITHHPVIFQPLKSVLSGSIAYRLLQNNISAISAHTNLDIAKGGVNAALCDALGFEANDIITVDDGAEMGIISHLENEMTPIGLAEHIKQRLGCKGIKFYNAGRSIKTVAMCSGASSHLLFDCAKKNADAFITADIKHSMFIEADTLGITLIDAGHFSTESVVLPRLKEYLQKSFEQTEFIIAESSVDLCSYI